MRSTSNTKKRIINFKRKHCIPSTRPSGQVSLAVDRSKSDVVPDFRQALPESVVDVGGCGGGAVVA